jgi:acid phosphatase (class A)
MLLRLPLLLLLLAVSAAAKYLAPGADPATVVPPPPAAGSIAAEADLLAARLFAANRTAEQAALAHRYERFDIFKMMQPVVGDWASPGTLPQLAAFITELLPEVRPITDKVKETHARPRPHLALPGLEPAFERPDGYSYPSGHATGAAMFAVLLTAIDPAHAADWERQAELVRLSRLYGGAHFPSDVLAGRRLGEAVGRAVLASPATAAKLEELRAEFARARAAAAPAA